jgi:general secretion pathway protein N
MTIQSAASDLPGDAIGLNLADESLLQGLGVVPVAHEDLPPVPLIVRGWSLAQLGVFGALVSLCLGLSITVYGELTEDGSTPVGSVAGGVAEASRAAVTQAEAPFALPPIESYAEVTARPLFSASRRPAPQQAAQRGSLEPASLALIGIIISSQSRIALVQEAKSPKPIRLTEGQEVQGWTVQSILPDRIVIRRGTLEQEVKLHAASQGAQAGAPASTARTQ